MQHAPIIVTLCSKHLVCGYFTQTNAFKHVQDRSSIKLFRETARPRHDSVITQNQSNVIYYSFVVTLIPRQISGRYLGPRSSGALVQLPALQGLVIHPSILTFQNQR